MSRIITSPPFYFFSALALCLASYFLFPEVDTIPFPYNLFGTVLIVSGGYLLNAGSNIFHKNETTFYLEQPSTFVKSDVYMYSRNPMYLGATILIVGLAILLGNMLALLTSALFFLAMNFLCIPPEEKIMEETFGKEYLEYKQKVRRWL